MSENENTEIGQEKLGCPCPPHPPFPPCPPQPWDDKGMAAAIAALTKLYQQLSDKVDAYMGELPEVKKGLADEIVARGAGDDELSSRITQETTERKSDIATAKTRIGVVETAVTVNSAKILEETRVRAAMKAELHAEIVSETEARVSGDRDLQRQIDEITGGSGSVIGRIEAEERARLAGDNALGVRINALEAWKPSVDADIEYLKRYGSKEYTDAKVAELKGEVEPRLQTVEETVEAVSSALTETQGKVNAVETKANTLEQNLETAKNDIRTNTESIVREAQERTSADANLDERVTALEQGGSSALVGRVELLEAWKVTVESRFAAIIENLQSLDARVTVLEQGGGGGGETGPFASVNMMGNDGNAYAVSVIPEEGTDEVVTDVTRLFVGGSGTAKAHYALQGNDGQVYKFVVVKPEDEEATTEVSVYTPMDGERVLPYIDFYCTDGHTYRLSVVKPEDEDATTNLSRIA